MMQSSEFVVAACSAATWKECSHKGVTEVCFVESIVSELFPTQNIDGCRGDCVKILLNWTNFYHSPKFSSFIHGHNEEILTCFTLPTFTTGQPASLRQ